MSTVEPKPVPRIMAQEGFGNPRFVNLGGGQPPKIRPRMLPPNAPSTFGPQQAAAGFMGTTGGILAALAPVAAVGTGLSYLNRPRTKSELEYMKEIGALDETMSESELDAYFKQRESKSQTGDQISFSDAFSVDLKKASPTTLRILGTPESRLELARREKEIVSKAEQDDLTSTMGVLKNELTAETDRKTKEFSDKIKKEKEKEDALTKKEGDTPKTKEQEIKDEADFIKGLLKDENVTRGETALILAEALSTPGGINKKLEKARALSLPLIRERAKQDKAVTLAAYQAFKEKEQQQIKAGALPSSLREIREQAKAIKAGGDPRSVEDIYNAEIAASRSVPYESRARAELLGRERQSILDTANTLAKAKDDLSKLDPIKDKKKYDRNKALYDKAFSNFNRDYLSVPEFRMLYQGIYDQFAPTGKQNGGRVMKALGGEAEEENDIITSNMDFGGEETPMKSVEKLDYATLRDRLPREITDQVVQLLSSSEEALQDFAYITSQNDVDNFNVKYGVNLMIPPTQQTT
jgi:hypothetical protein